MSQARTGLGVAVVDGKIYAIGGYTEYDSDVPVNGVGTNERYDPETDTWVTLTPMPTPRGNFAIAVYEDKIYCIGGYDRGNIYATSVKDFVVNEVYDTVTDSWSTKADAPSFSIIQANVVDGKIFATKSGTLYIYDPVTDSWTEKTGIPIGGWVSAVVDSKIIFSFNYYPNDIASGRPTEIVMIYDTQTDTYREASTPPKSYSSRITSVAIATTGVYAPQRVYILGLKHGIFNSNTVYDPINDTWLTAKALPVYREGFGVAVVDDVIYIIGGQHRALGNLVFFIPLKAISTNQQYIPVGYTGSVATTTPLLNYYSIAELALLIGIAACSLFFLFQKRKKD
jgi:N-acetylneuraminic acid mutarotase